ncbi:caspase-7-like [Saccostrea echinata]|uniref:caspase-7-like n=1 Tax=Saccostrea echinata TaxID=191078 RepID=UPI002A826BBA|nr:caspase-7-like [Saccostrea echinata]
MEENMNTESRQDVDVSDAKPISETDAFGFGKSASHSTKPVATTIQTASEFFSSKYKMDYDNRGKAIIINNKKFNPNTGLNDRNGTDVDASALCCRLSELDFEVDLFHNLKADEILSQLKKAAADDHRNNDCFACAILSHGEDGLIWGIDRLIPINDLLEPFKGNKCLSLAGKPKIFFIQACRGTKFDEGVDMNVADAKGFMDIEPQFSLQKIPSEADFLLAYSVVPGYYSWRNSSNGSWFVQALSEVLMKYGQTLDLLTMMTRVNQIVANKFQSNTSHPDMNEKKQIPCITSMLTKEVYFNSK